MLKIYIQGRKNMNEIIFNNTYVLSDCKQKKYGDFYNANLIMLFPNSNEKYYFSICANHSGFHLFPL